ncbi:MAG: hypothetical protein J5706_07165 [Elusimicrobiales bacterium]|nr:hypothetical protein [Elusimicrobiales bacterium]
MSNESLKREFITIRTTEWWSLFLRELDRRIENAMKNTATTQEAIQLYRQQGVYKALSGLRNSLTDPDFLMQSEEE